MIKPIFKNHHTLCVPVRIRDIVRVRVLQVTVSESAVSVRFDGPDPRRMRESLCRRYGIRIQLGRFGWAWYVEREVGTIDHSGSSTWALAE